jgi:hypothetical protein
MLPEIAIVSEEITTQPSDVAAILYSRNVPRLFFALFDEGILKESQLSPVPAARESKLVEPLRRCGFGKVLIVAAEDRSDVTYSTLRSFGVDVARGLAMHQPMARSVSMILHGPGYGLDVDDAFTQLMQGLIEGLSKERSTLTRLEHVYVMERATSRANRLTTLAAKLWGPPTVKRPVLKETDIVHRPTLRDRDEIPRTVAPVAPSRVVFVAMPFADDFMDTFEIGIYEPIKNLNIKCERSDSTAFAGDIVQRIRERIELASLIVAEVTTPNPNVYLEIGYAWGKNKPVLLVCRDTAEVNFDIRNHNCIKYKSLVDLRKKITDQVRQLVGEEDA